MSGEVFQRGETELVNIKNVETGRWDKYIGRENSYYGLSESRFANPFKLSDYPRGESVDLYELWFHYNLVHTDGFEEEAQKLQGETLACWCVPDRCHGMVVVEFLESNEVPIHSLRETANRVKGENLPGVSDEVKEEVMKAITWINDEF